MLFRHIQEFIATLDRVQSPMTTWKRGLIKIDEEQVRFRFSDRYFGQFATILRTVCALLLERCHYPGGYKRLRDADLDDVNIKDTLHEIQCIFGTPCFISIMHQAMFQQSDGIFSNTNTFDSDCEHPLHTLLAHAEYCQLPAFHQPQQEQPFLFSLWLDIKLSIEQKVDCHRAIVAYAKSTEIHPCLYLRNEFGGWLLEEMIRTCRFFNAAKQLLVLFSELAFFPEARNVFRINTMNAVSGVYWILRSAKVSRPNSADWIHLLHACLSCCNRSLLSIPIVETNYKESLFLQYLLDALAIDEVMLPLQHMTAMQQAMYLVGDHQPFHLLMDVIAIHLDGDKEFAYKVAELKKQLFPLYTLPSKSILFLIQTLGCRLMLAHDMSPNEVYCIFELHDNTPILRACEQYYHRKHVLSHLEWIASNYDNLYLQQDWVWREICTFI
jgi:hypothetical protein